MRINKKINCKTLVFNLYIIFKSWNNITTREEEEEEEKKKINNYNYVCGRLWKFNYVHNIYIRSGIDCSSKYDNFNE